jgi:hypothetical protein
MSLHVAAGPARRRSAGAPLLLALMMALHGLAATAQTLGEGGSKASGSAGPQGAQGEAKELEKCDAPKGTIAVVEPQDQVAANLQKYGLGSPTGVIRMLIQQSNCFQVVERGAAMANMLQERQLAQAGQMQAGSNVGRGQMVAADFLVTPSVVFSENNAGGAGGGLAGFGRAFGVGGLVAGAIIGGLKFKEAQTSMVLVDARSSIQVAAAQDSAKATDFSLGAALFGAGGAGALGGYTNTAEGKVIAASFIDNWNNITRSIRSNPSLIAPSAGAAAQANAAGSVQAGAAAAGDVLVPKIAGVKVLRSPNDAAEELQSLGRGDEVLFMGDEQGGFVKVTAPRGEGWVKKILLRKP